MLANCELAQYLAQKVRQSPLFELKAPVALNIVCFGVRGASDRAFNRELVLDMHETGVAVPSWTTIGGETVIRCAIVNHRTTRADIDRMMDCIEGLALSRCEAAASRYDRANCFLCACYERRHLAGTPGSACACTNA